MPARHFGDIPGILKGTTFPDRHALAQAGVHRPPQASISGGRNEGADSIVLSGGYEDDVDFGDVIIYTGHGGNNAATGKQVADQALEDRNLALAKSCLEGLPVRVVRRVSGPSSERYEYAGVFSVDSYWSKVGRSGFFIWQFRLIAAPEPLDEQSDAPPLTIRGQVFVQRIIRSTLVAQTVKDLHKHACQVCGQCIETPAGPYAEAAHIQPLGSPHNGPDVAENILCLCPNDHVRFDFGELMIRDDLAVMSRAGATLGILRMVPGHKIDSAYLDYHRKHFVPAIS
jgi:putative restriction endonuclease